MADTLKKMMDYVFDEEVIASVQTLVDLPHAQELVRLDARCGGTRRAGVAPDVR